MTDEIDVTLHGARAIAMVLAPALIVSGSAAG